MPLPGLDLRCAAVAAVLLAGPSPSGAETFRADRERSEAFDMVIETLPTPTVLTLGPGGATVDTVRHPQTISAVRVHVKVSAAPATVWTLRFRTLSGELIEELKSGSPQVVDGELWSDNIPGQGAEVALTGPAGLIAAIDAYARSDAQTTPQAIHGVNQLIPIARAPDEVRRYAPPVGRLRYMTQRGQGFCTGFLVSADLFVTNHHCVATATEAASAIVELGYDGYAATPVRHRVSRIEATDRDLDVSVLRLATRPDAAWGHLTLARRPSRERLPLLIVQHPGGQPKQASVDDCVVSGLQLVGLGADKTDFGHECDTEGGSSGSPVIDPVLGAVVGLHHLGFREDDPKPVNQAVHMDGILAMLSARHPALLAEMSVRP
jgi:hypothetical protein